MVLLLGTTSIPETTDRPGVLSGPVFVGKGFITNRRIQAMATPALAFQPERD
jgi:hypothetical protein